MRRGTLLLNLVFLAVLFLAVYAPASAAETAQDWILKAPDGAVKIEKVELAPRVTSLENKTIGLFWNGKHNGNNFLNRIGELLIERIPGVKIIKSWEIGVTPKINVGPENIQKMVNAKPDIVIASQCD